MSDSTLPRRLQWAMKVTLTQAIAVTVFLCGGAYSVGRVHADLDTHEAAEGHPALVKRVRDVELTQATVAAVLTLLEKRK